jgi:hypothetical protein
LYDHGAIIQSTKASRVPVSDPPACKSTDHPSSRPSREGTQVVEPRLRLHHRLHWTERDSLSANPTAIPPFQLSTHRQSPLSQHRSISFHVTPCWCGRGSCEHVIITRMTHRVDMVRSTQLVKTEIVVSYLRLSVFLYPALPRHT